MPNPKKTPRPKIQGKRSRCARFGAWGLCFMRSLGFGIWSFFSVTLSDGGANNVHLYQQHSPTYNGSGQLTGTWQADGKYIDPASSGSAFDSASSDTFNSQFYGYNPNGDWTLTFSDWVTSGDP